MIYYNGVNSSKYFEGWFFRISTDGLNMSLIPSISSCDGEKKAFIQINSDHSSKTLEYDYSEFYADDHVARIGDNEFSTDGIRFSGEDWYIDVRLGVIMPLNEDIMGCFKYGTPCKHKIISMRHAIEGVVRYKDKEYDLNNAVGYIEKDWGKSFPKSYCWIQCNHLDIGSDCAFFFSVAKLNIPICGLICSFIVGGKEYRFATYNLSRIKKLSHGEIILQKGELRLIINFAEGDSKELIAPSRGKMQVPIKEDLSGTIRLRLYEGGRLLYDTKGVNAGIEWVNMHT